MGQRVGLQVPSHLGLLAKAFRHWDSWVWGATWFFLATVLEAVLWDTMGQRMLPSHRLGASCTRTWAGHRARSGQARRSEGSGCWQMPTGSHAACLAHPAVLP